MFFCTLKDITYRYAKKFFQVQNYATLDILQYTATYFKNSILQSTPFFKQYVKILYVTKIYINIEQSLAIFCNISQFITMFWNKMQQHNAVFIVQPTIYCNTR